MSRASIEFYGFWPSRGRFGLLLSSHTPKTTPRPWAPFVRFGVLTRRGGHPVRATSTPCPRRADNTRARAPSAPASFAARYRRHVSRNKRHGLTTFQRFAFVRVAAFSLRNARVLPRQFCSGPYDGSGTVHDQRTMEAPSDVRVWSFQ